MCDIYANDGIMLIREGADSFPFLPVVLQLLSSLDCVTLCVFAAAGRQADV